MMKNVFETFQIGLFILFFIIFLILLIRIGILNASPALKWPGAWVLGLALGTRGSYWFNFADFISFSKKFTCWVLKGPTGQRSHGKAACRGVGVGAEGNIAKLGPNLSSS